MELISLFSENQSSGINQFTIKAFDSVTCTYDSIKYLYISPEKIDNIIDLDKQDHSKSRKSCFSAKSSSLRSFIVSGYISDKQASDILDTLTKEPFQDESIGDSLYVHLSTEKLVLEKPENNKSDKDGSDLFEIISPQATMEDLILPKDLKDRIKRNLKVMKYRHVLLDDWGLKDVAGLKNKLSLSLNFIGSSGTGKTFAAEVIANELQKPLMTVDYASLESKYPGDTSKHIKTVFKAASKHGAVLFFDEADSFLGRRMENITQSHDASVNNSRSVMLMELAKFDGVIIFATNIVSNYDPAFRRRILDHIEFPLPDEEARAIILEKHTPANLPGGKELDFQLLATKSEGLSAAEIANVVYKSCILLVDRLDLNDPDLKTCTEDFLISIKEVQKSRELIKDTKESPGIKLNPVSLDNIIKPVQQDTANSLEPDSSNPTTENCDENNVNSDYSPLLTQTNNAEGVPPQLAMAE
jgi:SpoVK/Ycf46/Vps4 family AAA+-type ATPase